MNDDFVPPKLEERDYCAFSIPFGELPKAPIIGRGFSYVGKSKTTNPPTPASVGYYAGFEVYRLPTWHQDSRVLVTPAGLPATETDLPQLLDDREWPRNPDGSPTWLVPIRQALEMRDGLRVLWKGTHRDYLWCWGTVRRQKNGACHIQGDHGLSGTLHFAEDDRKCWTTGTILHEAAIARADFS